jgi:hypothetical protein
MRLLNFGTFVLILTLSVSLDSLYGQAAPEAVDTVRKNAIKVFLDCRTCDMNYIREEIPYINYVRDVTEAQVFILVTNMSAGSGGSQYTYTFQGQHAFKGMNDTLTFTSSPDQTRPVIRDKTTNMMKMGLMRYVARTPLANEIAIGHSRQLRSEEVVDRWNNWVVELSTNPRYNGEATYSNLNFRNSIDVSRVTEALKFEFRVNQNLNYQRYTTDDFDTTYRKKSEYISALLVKSLNEHWSAGITIDLGSSTMENYIFNSELMPALEYNLFPYADASHRQLRFQYSAGVQFSSYRDTTLVDNMMQGTFYREAVRVAYQIQEKWGTINLSLSSSHYFHDFSKNQVGLDGFVNVRVFKGLSVSLNGGVRYFNDQLNLAKGELSEAERLLRLKQQASNYDINASLGLTYVFGSIYNNVVNPRFGRSQMHF